VKGRVYDTGEKSPRPHSTAERESQLLSWEGGGERGKGGRRENYILTISLREMEERGGEKVMCLTGVGEGGGRKKSKGRAPPRTFAKGKFGAPGRGEKIDIQRSARLSRKRGKKVTVSSGPGSE